MSRLTSTIVTARFCYRGEIWQEVGGLIPVSLAPAIVIRAADKTRARESGDAANIIVQSNFSTYTYIGKFSKLARLQVYLICACAARLQSHVLDRRLHL